MHPINSVASIANGLKKLTSAVINKLAPSSKKTPNLEIQSTAKDKPKMQQLTDPKLNQNQSIKLGRAAEVQNIRANLEQTNKIPPPLPKNPPKALIEAQQRKSKTPPPLPNPPPPPIPANFRGNKGMGR